VIKVALNFSGFLSGRQT